VPDAPKERLNMNTKKILCELLFVPVLLAACAGDGSDGESFGAELDETAGTEAGDDEDTGDGESGGEDESGGETTDAPVDEDTGEDPTGADTEGDGDTGDTGEPPDTDDTGDTEVEPPYGDGDSSDLPAVVVQFRNTAGVPISVEGPLFNEDAIDTRGLQYLDAVGQTGDESDHLAFNIVPGEVDPTIRLLMECDDETVRAEIRDESDALLGSALCGEGEQSILLRNAASFTEYRIVVLGAAVEVDYVMSLNAFCFQQCNYTPYVP
jgi:hypothetical protein